MVPMPRKSLLESAFWCMTWLAYSTASRRRRTPAGGWIFFIVWRLENRRLGTVVTQSWLATSPANSPPIPSATSSRIPRSRRVKLCSVEFELEAPSARLQTVKLSSLFFRTRPLWEDAEYFDVDLSGLGRIVHRVGTPYCVQAADGLRRPQNESNETFSITRSWGLARHSRPVPERAFWGVRFLMPLRSEAEEGVS